MIERRQFIKQVAAGAVVLAMPYLWLPRKSAIAQVAPNIAFIGAQGHGAGANGWRSPTARILFVTNRNNSGAGSLQAALATTSPRYIIFQVGGRWTITTPFSDEAGSGNYYLAGQSAPGDGVSITSGASPVGGDNMLYRISQSHVCCRFIRLRGTIAAGGNTIGLGIRGPAVTRSNIIVDHCSVSWIPDDNISTAWLNGFTLQWCLSSESISYGGGGSGGRGLLMADQANISNLSVHYNFFAHNAQRNPDCSGVPGVELINNLVYNGGDNFVNVSNYWQSMTANIRGNYFKWGPSSQYNYSTNSANGKEIQDHSQSANSASLYVNDCIAWVPTGGGQEIAARELGGLPRTGSPHNFNPAVPIAIHAGTAVPGFLSQFGAIKPKRDAIDASVVTSYSAYTNPPHYSNSNPPTSWVIADATDTLLGGFPAYNDSNNDTATNLSPSGMTQEFITRMGLANTTASALSMSISAARGLGEPYQNIEWNLMEQAGDIAPLQGSGVIQRRLSPPGNLRQ